MRGSEEAGALGALARRALLLPDDPGFVEIAEVLADLAIRESRETAMVLVRGRAFGLSPDALAIVVDEARQRADAATLGHQIILALVPHQVAVRELLRAGSNRP